MKIYAPFAGIVHYHVAAGDTVTTGQKLASVEATEHHRGPQRRRSARDPGGGLGHSPAAPPTTIPGGLFKTPSREPSDQGPCSSSPETWMGLRALLPLWRLFMIGGVGGV